MFEISQSFVLLSYQCQASGSVLTLKVPENLQLYGLYVYYVVHICDFGMLKALFNNFSL